MNIIPVWGDITEIGVDAIVNAANRELLGGGGVDGAIHKAAGPQLLEECRALSGCETGEAKITHGYQLPARYVIHTVGPIWGRENGAEENLLRSCYLACLNLAANNGSIRSIAFPAISTGCYGYPAADAARIAVESVRKFDAARPGAIESVYLVAYDRETYSLYEAELSRV